MVTVPDPEVPGSRTTLYVPVSSRETGSIQVCEQQIALSVVLPSGARMLMSYVVDPVRLRIRLIR